MPKTTPAAMLPRLKMPYGKWKGHFLDELPESYLNWLLANCVTEAGETTLPLGIHAAVQAILANGGHTNGHILTHRRPTHANPHAAYAAFEQEQLKLGGWAALPRSWCRAFGIRAAGVLTHLVNRGKVAADPDGWFFCDRLLDELGLDDAQAAKVLDRLEDRGVIELNGRRSTRVRLLLDDLKAALEENP